MKAGNLGGLPTTGSRVLAPVVIAPQEAADSNAVQRDPSTPVAPISVLHVDNGEHFSGAERVQSHLGRCLPEFSVAADFACVKPVKFAQMLREHDGHWGKCFETPMSNRFDLSAAWKVRGLIREHGYDLLHAHTPRTAMVTSLASKMTGVPWVYHVHSPTARDSSRTLINHVNSTTEKLAIRSCDHLITVSESLRLDCIRRGTSEIDVSVVHNGVPGIRPARQATPVVGGRWVIGMVALMRPRKGLEIVLQSVAKLCGQHDLMLRIIGPFETEAYEQGINQQINELGIQDRIERVGFTNDVPSELARLDAMVLPSLYGEGLPMVVLEAMAAGLPVIATRVEGTPEAVTDGVEGLLAEPRDPDSLAQKIDELLSGVHDWHQMAEAAQERHAKEFSDTAMAKKTSEVYRRVLERLS